MIMLTENPTETEPHKGIRFIGCRIEPKLHRFGFRFIDNSHPMADHQRDFDAVSIHC